MKKIAIAVHGGAGSDSDFIKEHEEDYKNALAEAVNLGYEMLEKGENAVDVVEKVVCFFEDHELFNAGKGSAITNLGKVEMCASIMDGKDLASGAAATVYNVKNPVKLAREIMDHTEHVYLSDYGALAFAKEAGIELKDDFYFHTEHQIKTWKDAREKEIEEGGPEIKEGTPVDHKKKKHSHSGTVGCVALDQHGNLAAATSTGGTENCKEGRIGDSSMIGVGTYANNNTCAVSCTGDGEYAIRGVLAHDVAAVMEYKGLSVNEAIKFVLFEKNKHVDGDLGIIAVSKDGDVALEYNCDRMHRGSRSTDKPLKVAVYKD